MKNSNGFRQMLTGKDNVTVDAFRVLAVLSVLVGMALEVASTFWALKGHPFDLQAFGIGIGGLLLAAGGALKLKESTEPTGEGTTMTATSTTQVTERTP